VASGETSIPLTLTPMTVGPLQETLQITIGGAEHLILVKKYNNNNNNYYYYYY